MTSDRQQQQQSSTGHGALQFIAEGIVALAGFQVVAISVVDGPELRTIAVAGSEEAAAEIMDLRSPVADILAELEPAEDWGRLLFVPQERAPGGIEGYQWVAAYEPLDVVDAWLPEDLLCALLRDDDGELRGVLSIDLPQSGRRPDEAQRRILNVYAEQAERAVVSFVRHDELTQELAVQRQLSHYRRQLIDVLSHELQTPMTVIVGRVELALEGELAGDVREHLAAIARASTRVTAMTQNLLAMAKVDDPGRALETSVVDVAAVVTEVVQLLSDDAATREIQLSAVTPDGAALTEGHGGELTTAVTNLAANALKYSDRGGIVSLRVTGGDGGADIVVAVTDDGIGISEEDAAHLFEEFFRSPSEAARRRPGTGLGLAIVDRIVRRHRGHIDVQSTLGVGTTISITLPAARGPEEPVHPPTGR